MPPVFDAKSQLIEATGSGSMTLSHTCSGSDRILFVGIAQDRNNVDPTVTGVTYNSVAMTNVAQGSTDFAVRTSLWRLIAPATGANDVVASFSAAQAQPRIMVAVSYTGADQTTGVRTEQGGSDNTDTDAISVTYTNGQAGDLIVDWAAARGAVNTLAAGANQTERANTAQGAALIAGFSEEAGAASVVMNWTWAGTTDASRINAIGIIPAAGGGGPVIPVFMNQYRQRWR